MPAGRATLLEAMRKVHQYTIMSAPTMGQAAAVAAMLDPQAEGRGAGHDRQLRPAAAG
jgi:aspartate/methionine/tyrosine aminotransferase